MFDRHVEGEKCTKNQEVHTSSRLLYDLGPGSVTAARDRLVASLRVQEGLWSGCAVADRGC